MQCGKCKTDNSETRRFCRKCGAALTIACSCGFLNEPGDRFCGGCGAPVQEQSKPDRPAVREFKSWERASRDLVDSAAHSDSTSTWARNPGERRPVTMMFTDIVGSTGLTEHLDAEETHELIYGAIQRLCESVERCRGTVCRFMGDGLMAMFGAPVAFEDHALRACEAALAMHEAIRQYGDGQLRIRVGLHTGEVVVLDVGEEGHKEYDASGPAVPIAARMEQNAPPGETYLTAATLASIRDRIEVNELEPISVKGVSTPVPVYALRGLVAATPPAEPAAVSQPIIGRRAELAQCMSLLEVCGSGDHGQALHIRGDAGIGKTRLVTELQRSAEDRGFGCYRSLVLDFGSRQGEDAIQSLVAGWLDLVPDASADARRRAVAAAVVEQRIENDHRAALNDLLELPQPVELMALYEAMDSPRRARHRRAVVASLMRSAAGRRPILVIVEDIHWASGETLEHLAEMTRVAAECPILLVTTTRIEGDPHDEYWRDSVQGSPITTIDLASLRPNEALQLATQYVQAKSELIALCVQRAGGNPLFLEQLLRNVEESGSQNVPDSIQSLVLARMDRLPAEDRRALQAASVLGQRFDLEVLRHVMEDSTYEPRGLLRTYLIRPEGEGFLFAHALIQESVYRSLLKSTRSRLHGIAGAWYEDRDPVLYAEHLDHAGDPAACAAYRDAAAAELRLYRPERALTLVRRGLDLAAGDSERFELTCLEGRLQHDLGAMEPSIDAWERALELAEGPADRCRARIGIAQGMRVVDRIDDALQMLDSAQVLATEAELETELSQIHYLRGGLYFPLGRVEACLDEHAKALEHARAAGSAEDEARALSGLGDAEYARGRMTSAYENFRRCIALCEEHGFGRIEAANRFMVATVRIYLNQLDEALADALQSAEIGAKVGNPRAEIVSRLTAGWIYFERNALEQADAEVQKGMDIASKIGARRFEPFLQETLARGLFARGERAAAIDMAEGALESAREVGALNFIGPWLLGTLAMVVDSGERRQAALAEGEQILAEGAVGHNYYHFYRAAMAASLAAGDPDSANRYAEALERYTAAEPNPWATYFVEWGRALAAHALGDRGAEVTARLERLREGADMVGAATATPLLDAALSGST